MAELCNGNRVFTAATGTASSADINNLQDQLKDVMKARWQALPLGAGVETSGAASAWSLDDEVWQTGANPDNDSILYLTIPAKAGDTVTALKTVIESSSGDNNSGAGAGSIKVVKRSVTDVAGGSGWTAVTTVDASPWDTTGRQTINGTSLDIVIDDESEYAIQYVAPEPATGNTCTVYYAQVQCKTGNDD
jgi:hypothetical protein